MLHRYVLGSLALGLVIGACALFDSQQVQPPQPRQNLRIPPPAPPPAPPAHVDQYASTACPSDITLALARSIDGRAPKRTLPGPYANEHMKPVPPEQLISRDDAIARVLAVEAKTPSVVPASFRDDLVGRARDADFRLHMARCELDSAITIRRAGYDAALAFLLGAAATDALPLVKRSFHPNYGDKIEGTTRSGKKTSVDRSEINSQPCERDAQCYESKCDAVTGTCQTKEAHIASFLSPAELDIEDALSHAFAAIDPPRGMHTTPAEELIRIVAYGRYVRCTRGPLCSLTHYEQHGVDTLVTWDRRYHGESYTLKTTKAQDISANCYQHARHTSLQSCNEACDAPAHRFEHEDHATCRSRCSTYCQ